MRRLIFGSVGSSVSYLFIVAGCLQSFIRGDDLLSGANSGNDFGCQPDDDKHCIAERRARLFDRIYETGFWTGTDASASTSGVGSSAANATAAATALSEVIRTFRIKSVLDLGCGDQTWLQGVDWPLDLRYVGVDISSVLIERLRAKPSRRNNTEYFQMDAVEQVIESPAFDLILVRDVIGHLPLHNSVQLLRNVQSMRPKFLLAKTFLRTDANQRSYRLAHGELVNLFKPPFCLSDPLRLFHDDFFDAYLGLWKVAGSAAALVPTANTHMVNYGLDDACSRTMQQHSEINASFHSTSG